MNKPNPASLIRRFEFFKLMITIGLLGVILFLVFYTRPFPHLWPVDKAVEEEIVTNSATPTVDTATTVESTETIAPAQAVAPTQTDSTTTILVESTVTVAPTQTDSTTTILVEATQAVEPTAAVEPTQTDSTTTILVEPTVVVEPTQTDSTTILVEPTVVVEPTQTDSTTIEVKPIQTAEPSPVIVPTVESTQTAPPSSVSGPVLNLPSKNLTVSGKGEPGLQVQILIDGQLVGETSIGSDGQWVFTTEISEAGEHQVSMQQLDQNSQIVGTSGPISVFISLPASPSSDLVCESIYLVLADEWLSGIAQRYWDNAFLYPAIMTATNQKHAQDDTFAQITNANFVRPGWKLCLVDKATASQMRNGN